MGSSSDKTQQTYSPTVPYAADIAKSANELFNAGIGYHPYTGSVLAPVGEDTTAGLDMTRHLAGQQVPGLSNALNYGANMIEANGLTPGLNVLNGRFDNIANANGLTPDMRDEASVLAGIAAGNQQEDPRLARQLEINANRAVNGAATRFGGGRYGSAAIGQGVGQAVTDANNGTMLQSNENARGRQLQAAGLLDNIYQQGANRALSAANSMGGIYENGLARASGAASMLPALNNLRYDGASRLAGIGDYYDQRAQTQQDANIKAWEANQNIDWNRLGAFANILSGVAPSAGSMVRTSGGKPSAAAGILGGASTGASLGSMFGPWGTAIGAIGGGILGGVS